jgi:quinol monooxygenase YgiN
MTSFTRREFVTSAVSLAPAVTFPACVSLVGEQTMYAVIGRIRVLPGRRDALIAILLDGVSGMPGCLSYVIARDPSDPDAIWITEVWASQDSHQASLSLASVRDAISRGRPLIAGMDQRIETTPVGGHGLRAPA